MNFVEFGGYGTEETELSGTMVPLYNNEISVRTFERGVEAETYACGTGACASAVAAVLNGYCKHDEEILIHLRGGDLTIVYRSDETVLMKGPAAFICDGTVDDQYINELKENAVCRS